MPLVLNWHGLGGRASDQLYSGLPAKADEAGFIVVAPQGLGNPANHNFATIAASPDDVAFTGDMLDALEKQLCIDSARIFSTGISNGAQMSGRLACDLSERIAAIAPVSGSHFPPFSPDIPEEPGCFSTRPVAIIAFHGTADSVIPFNGGPGIFGITFRPIEDTVIPEWAAHNGCAAEPVADQVTENVGRVRYQGCDQDATVELYVIEGGGHVWPGALGATQEISATELMWEFFQAHPLESPEPVATAAQQSDTEGASQAPITDSDTNTGLVVAIAAAAVAGVVALGSAAWYARGRRR